MFRYVIVRATEKLLFSSTQLIYSSEFLLFGNKAAFTNYVVESRGSSAFHQLVAIV